MTVEDTLLLKEIRTGINGLGTPTIAPGDVEIGAVEIKDGTTDARALVGAGNAAGVGDIALTVADANTLAKLTTIDGHVDGLEAAIGTTADAAVISDANGSHSGFLRGIVKLLAMVIDQTLGAIVMRLKSDVVTGALYHLDVTLSATPETLTTITIPDTVRGFKMYSTLGALRFALNEAPATPRAASSATTIAAAAFGVAGTVWQNIPETRLIPPGVSRTLQLRSGTASNLVSIELF